MPPQAQEHCWDNTSLPKSCHQSHHSTYFFSSILSSTVCLAWSPFACTWSLPYLVGHREQALSTLHSAAPRSSLLPLHTTPSSAKGSG